MQEKETLERELKTQEDKLTALNKKLSKSKRELSKGFRFYLQFSSGLMTLMFFASIIFGRFIQTVEYREVLTALYLILGVLCYGFSLISLIALFWFNRYFEKP